MPIYIALGWAAVFFRFAASFVGQRRGTAVLVLIVVGGGLYTLGGVVYGLKRPDPFPRWFGFHEVFHSLHDRGVRRPLRRRLDRDVLPALTGVTLEPATWDDWFVPLFTSPT